MGRARREGRNSGVGECRRARQQADHDRRAIVRGLAGLDRGVQADDELIEVSRRLAVGVVQPLLAEQGAAARYGVLQVLRAVGVAPEPLLCRFELRLVLAFRPEDVTLLTNHLSATAREYEDRMAVKFGRQRKMDPTPLRHDVTGGILKMSALLDDHCPAGLLVVMAGPARHGRT